MRMRPLVTLLHPHIPQHSRVIDIGAGDCSIAQQLSEIATVTPLDVRDYNKTDLQLVLYEGKSIPFPNNAFDLSLLIFVLHHAPNYLVLLQEAARVSSTLIILEDTPQNPLEYLVWRVIDYLWNFFHDPRPALPAKRVKQWEELFSDQSLQIVEKRSFRLASTLFAFPQTLFVLKKG